MNKKIGKVLEKLESNGYEAYIVGGFTRDLLLGISSYDVDICTNATPKDLIKLFPCGSTKNLGGISFKIKEYNYDITTYREEIKYQNRRPIKYNYVNSLITDLQRRDFTINTICMNKKGDIIDLLKGVDDLNRMVIKMVGDKNQKLEEDPLRILRAIRLATVLNFQIEEDLYQEIIKHKKDILKLSNTRIREELDKILISKNVKKGLEILKNTGILDLLKITYNDIVSVKNIEAMYAQLNINYKLSFTKQEKEHIENIRKIVKKGKINPKIIYEYGLYLTRLAGVILNIKQKDISEMYKKLKIKERKDIKIEPLEIVKILNMDAKRKISTILKELEDLIINGKLNNEKEDIIKYLENNKSRWV